MNEKFFIAQIGRTVGLMGDLKLHLHTDFPEQFKVGSIFESDRGNVEIISYNPIRGIIRFRGYEGMDSAKKLTNAKIYTTQAKTEDECKLKQNEYFWFDIIGCKVVEDDEVLGIIEDIDRLGSTDYLEIITDDVLVQNGLPKRFLIPYIPRYIASVDLEKKELTCKDAKVILENS